MMIELIATLLYLFELQSDVTTDPALRRHGSAVSLQSHTLSTTSAGSLKRSQRILKEKLCEIETFRDILYRQIDTMQV